MQAHFQDLLLIDSHCHLLTSWKVCTMYLGAFIFFYCIELTRRETGHLAFNLERLILNISLIWKLLEKRAVKLNQDLSL